jgi:hypothetical protein
VVTSRLVTLADDECPLLRREVEPLLVRLGDGDLEPLAYRLPPLTRCEPTAHEVGSLSIRPDGAESPRKGKVGGPEVSLWQ